MIRKWILPLAALAAMTTVLAGCGEEKNANPYARVSLRQATYGPTVVSKGYKYEIVNPTIVQAKGSLCLVREGNVTTFVVGRSLADKIAGLDPSHITFDVVKKYSPFVHFKAQQVVSGADTVFISSTGSIFYPHITPAASFTSPDFNAVPMSRFRWNASAKLKKMEEKKYSVRSKLARVEEEGEEHWMLVGDRGSLRIDSPTDADEIVLSELLKNQLDFEGGITFTQTEEWTARRNNHVAGTVSIDYVKFMNRVFS